MSHELHDLESDIRRTIERYVDENREVIEHMSGTESIAQRVLDSIDEAIEAVRSPLGPDISTATSRFASLPSDYVEAAYELFTARAYDVLLPDMVLLEKRLEALIGMGVNAAPSERASATLSKIARSYLLGLDAETIAMCRAAVDVSVNDAIEPLESEAAGRGIRLVSMRDKLEYLRAVNRLPEFAKSEALEVWRRGSEVLHSNTENTRDVFEIAAKTLRVIAGLFPVASTPFSRVDNGHC